MNGLEGIQIKRIKLEFIVGSDQFRWQLIEWLRPINNNISKVILTLSVAVLDSIPL